MLKLVLAILLVSPPAFAGQTPNPPGSPAMETIQKQMRRYMHDITELPLVVHSESTVTNHDGRVTSRHQSAHNIVYESGSGTKKNMEAYPIGKDKPTVWEQDADLGLLASAYVVLPEVWFQGFDFSSPEVQNETVLVKYHSKEQCSPWDNGPLGYGLKFRHWCGTGELRFHQDSYEPASEIYDATLMPPKGTHKDVPAYHFEITFQKVNVQGHPAPFIIPLNFVQTVTSKEETTVVRSTVTVAESKQAD